jgi:hypothetical protein
MWAAFALGKAGSKSVIKEVSRMSNIRKSLIATTCSLLLVGVAYASGDWLKGTTDQKLEKLAEIQPGLGTVMIEYSHRYSTMYHAAKGGNWGLAGYQLKEALEIQEVGPPGQIEQAP